MKRIKIIIALLISFILICTLIPKSFAAGSFSASLTPNTSRVSKGGEVTVTLKLSGINVQGGIAALMGTLRFDSDALSLADSDIKPATGWSKTYDEDSKKLIFDRSDVVKSDCEVATMKFKVNSSTSVTTAAIQFVSIAAGNADIEDEVKISDITTNIAIGSTITNSPSNSSSPSNSPSNTPSQSPTTPSTSPTLSPSSTSIQTTKPTTQNSGNGQSTTNGDSNIPKTGSDNYVLPLMIFIGVMGIISFINYKRIDNE